MTVCAHYAPTYTHILRKAGSWVNTKLFKGFKRLGISGAKNCNSRRFSKIYYSEGGNIMWHVAKKILIISDIRMLTIWAVKLVVTVIRKVLLILQIRLSNLSLITRHHSITHSKVTVFVYSQLVSNCYSIFIWKIRIGCVR